MTTAPNASTVYVDKQFVFMRRFCAQATDAHEVVSKFQLLEDDSMAMCYLPDDLCVA